MKMTVQDKEALRSMTDAQFSLAGITWNLSAVPSIALEMICARYAEKIAANPDAKWLSVDADGDVFIFGLHPEDGWLFDMWHISDDDDFDSVCLGTLKKVMRNHLRLATNWREYLIEVNQ